MRRRNFIAGVSGAALAWPLGARGQMPERMAHIGLLMGAYPNDPEQQSLLATFSRALERLGWNDGRNLRMDVRWTGNNDPASNQPAAAELIKLAPDVIVANPSGPLDALRRQTTSIPIVFLELTDPVRQGFVSNLARPGGNITGFPTFDFSIAAKWLQLLKELTPDLSHVLLLDQENMLREWVQASKAAAASVGVELVTVLVHDDAEIERAITAFGGQAHRALYFPLSRFYDQHRATIIEMAARHHLPAIYARAALVRSGGLMSYAADRQIIWQGAASYVDRILRGEKPGDLPIQNPTNFNLVINLGTARALGLTIPPSLLARADEVIE